MTTTSIRTAALCLAPLLLIGAAGHILPTTQAVEPQAERKLLQVHYLEIVTPSVKETCEALAQAHAITFGNPIPELGNARTANLKDGGRIGVRAPLRASEDPVVRPYLLVDDINAAVEAAKKAGGEIAIPPMELPGQGTFAIYVLGGIDHGLWQN